MNVPRSLLCDILPGPVTVVLERSCDLNPNFNPGTNLIGIRIPDHPFMIDLAKECDGPIALTSANISNTRSSLSVEVGGFCYAVPVGVIICNQAPSQPQGRKSSLRFQPLHSVG